MQRQNTTPQWIIELKEKLRKEKAEASLLRQAAKQEKNRDKKPKKKKSRKHKEINRVHEEARKISAKVVPKVDFPCTEYAKTRASEMAKEMTQSEMELSQVLVEILPR